MGHKNGAVEVRWLLSGGGRLAHAGLTEHCKHQSYSLLRNSQHCVTIWHETSRHVTGRLQLCLKV